jgi:hypothetical protein
MDLRIMIYDLRNRASFLSVPRTLQRFLGGITEQEEEADEEEENQEAIEP